MNNDNARRPRATCACQCCDHGYADTQDTHTKRERLASLERRVADLEARPYPYTVWWGTPPRSGGGA